MKGVTDVDELNRILDRTVGLRTFLSADDRIEKVASFVAQNFQENVMYLGYKAFLGGVNREKPTPSISRRWTSCCRRNGRRRCTQRTTETSLTVPWQRSFNFPAARGRCPGQFQESGQGPQDTYRYRQAAEGLRRSTALLRVPRRADAGPHATASNSPRNRPYADAELGW